MSFVFLHIFNMQLPLLVTDGRTFSHLASDCFLTLGDFIPKRSKQISGDKNAKYV